MSSSNNTCTQPGCSGRIIIIRTGGFHKGTRAARYKCNTCGATYASLQFFIPTEQLYYATLNNKRWMTFRHPMTVDLDPDLEPEIRIHYPDDRRSLLGG